MKYCPDCGAHLQQLKVKYESWESKYRCTKCEWRLFNKLDSAYVLANELLKKQTEIEADEEFASAFLTDLRQLVSEIDDCVNRFDHLRSK